MSITTWIKGARWRKSLSHCAVGLLVQLPVTLLTLNPLAGVVAVIAWYWSRECCQFQYRVKAPGGSTVDVWNRGLLPWEWGRDSLLDLLLPTASSVALGLLFSHLIASAPR